MLILQLESCWPISIGRASELISLISFISVLFVREINMILVPLRVSYNPCLSLHYLGLASTCIPLNDCQSLKVNMVFELLWTN